MFRLLRVLVPVVLLALCAARNLPWRVADYDQAKQAFASLELAGGGDPFFQHTPGFRLLATKPPLLGWASAALHGAGVPWEAAWRLPSLLAAAALALLLWRAGRALWPGGGGGWLAVGIFGLNLLTPRLATLARTDMLLALWTTTAGLLVWRRRRLGGAWTPGERWALCGALTAGMLTKGPIILAFLLPGLVGLRLWERSPRTDDFRPGAVPRWPWVLSLGVFALWVVVGCGTVPGFREQVVKREFLGRFDYSHGAAHVPQPVWSYVVGLPGRLGPWSLLLLATAVLARPAWRAAGRDPAGRWLIAWAAGGLVLMSLVPSKRPDRVFPVIPPLALLLTAVVGRSRGATGAARVETLARWTTAAALAFAATATGYEVHKAHHRHGDALDRFGRAARRLAAARGWRPPELAVGPRVDEADDTLLVCLRRLRWLEDPAALAAWHAGRVDALVMRPTTLETLRPALGPSLTIAARVPDGSYVLITRPGANDRRQMTNDQ